MKNLKSTYLVTLLIVTLLLSCELNPKTNANLHDQHAQVVVFYPGYPDTLNFTYKEYIQVTASSGGCNYIMLDKSSVFQTTAPLKLLQP